MSSSSKELLGGRIRQDHRAVVRHGQADPAQSDQLRAWAHERQPNIAVNSRVGNDRADFESDGTDAVRERARVHGQLFDIHKTWGYANRTTLLPHHGYPDCTEEEDWDHIQQVDSCAACVRPRAVPHEDHRDRGNMFSTVALGGRFLFNVGPEVRI